jgi:hypothetical protein
MIGKGPDFMGWALSRQRPESPGGGIETRIPPTGRTDLGRSKQPLQFVPHLRADQRVSGCLVEQDADDARQRKYEEIPVPMPFAPYCQTGNESDEPVRERSPRSEKARIPVEFDREKIRRTVRDGHGTPLFPIIVTDRHDLQMNSV